MTGLFLIKAAASSFLSATGYVDREVRRRARDSSVILMYHRILPRERAQDIQAGMYVEPETFAAHLRFLQEHFTLAPLHEYLAGRGGRPGNGSNGKPVCALTFDDGWRDFREHAFPILKSYGIPATVFLPTDFIGTEKWFWTDRLSYCLSMRAEKVFPAGGRAASGNSAVNLLESLNAKASSQMESAIKLLKGYRAQTIEEILGELMDRWELDSSCPPGRAFLDWAEVKEMERSGIISFGSHTASHRILTILDEREIKEEMHRSRDTLVREGAVSPSFIPFSYPNGNHNPGIAELAKGAGYAMAVTTRKGWNDRNEDPFALRRIPLHQDVSRTEAMLGCRVVNLF